MQIRPAHRPFLACAIALSLIGASCGNTVEGELGTQATTTVAPPTPPTEVIAETTVPGTAPELLPSGGSTPPTTEPDGTPRLEQGIPSVPGSELVLSESQTLALYRVESRQLYPEPPPDSSSCLAAEGMWAAHDFAGPGIATVGFGDEALEMRQSVLQLDDEAMAEAVLDAVVLTGATCVEFDQQPDGFWVEPLETPDVDGWQTAAIAYGDERYTWTVTWFQRDNVVVVLDVHGESPWATQAAWAYAVGELVSNGHRVPLGPPTTPPPAEPPSTTPPNPVEPDDDQSDWTDHPAAPFVPSADLFGPGWELASATTKEATPPDETERVEGCDVDPPAIPSQIEVEYEFFGDDPSDAAAFAQVILAHGDADTNRVFLEAIEAISACDLDEDLTVVDAESSADRLVAFDTTPPNSVEWDSHIVIGVYGDTLVGVFYVDFQGTTSALTVQDLADIADEIATLG